MRAWQPFVGCEQLRAERDEAIFRACGEVAAKAAAVVKRALRAGAAHMGARPNAIPGLDAQGSLADDLRARAVRVGAGPRGDAPLGAAYGAELAGAQQRSNNAVESLTVRLQALEAAVQQEQQSSLKALQAILHSAHAR